MTYCLATSVEEGQVFLSDSRTHAGTDQVSSYSKMHAFDSWPDRKFVVLSAGNLGTTQAVIHQLEQDIEDDADRSLYTVARMADAAEYLGELSRAEQSRYEEGPTAGFDPAVSFAIGGQIDGEDPALFLVYPQGNYIKTADSAPYFQLGETKYGTPTLERLLERSTPLEDCAQCALMVMDATMRYNVTVGPPVEVMLYRASSLELGPYRVFEEGDPYLLTLREARDAALRKLLHELPEIPWEPSES
jgi:putative proteasome-type protease